MDRRAGQDRTKVPLDGQTEGLDKTKFPLDGQTEGLEKTERCKAAFAWVVGDAIDFFIH